MLTDDVNSAREALDSDINSTTHKGSSESKVQKQDATPAMTESHTHGHEAADMKEAFAPTQLAGAATSEVLAADSEPTQLAAIHVATQLVDEVAVTQLVDTPAPASVTAQSTNGDAPSQPICGHDSAQQAQDAAPAEASGVTQVLGRTGDQAMADDGPASQEAHADAMTELADDAVTIEVAGDIGATQLAEGGDATQLADGHELTQLADGHESTQLAEASVEAQPADAMAITAAKLMSDTVAGRQDTVSRQTNAPSSDMDHSQAQVQKSGQVSHKDAEHNSHAEAGGQAVSTAEHHAMEIDATDALPDIEMADNSSPAEAVAIRKSFASSQQHTGSPSQSVVTAQESARTDAETEPLALQSGEHPMPDREPASTSPDSSQLALLAAPAAQPEARSMAAASQKGNVDRMEELPRTPSRTV